MEGLCIRLHKQNSHRQLGNRIFNSERLCCLSLKKITEDKTVAITIHLFITYFL